MYYIARRVQPNTIDMELLLYFLLTTTKASSMRKFDLVFDATLFSVENEWDLEWVRRLEVLLPGSVAQNIGTLYIHNCNTVFRKFIKSCTRVLDSNSIADIVFTSGVDELHAHIPANELRLPRSTYIVEKEITDVFMNVNCLSKHREYIPVVLKVATDSIHMTAGNFHEMFGQRFKVTDMFRYSDIEDIHQSKEEREVFAIKYSEKISGLYGTGITGNTTLTTITLWSPKADIIVKTIRAAKSRYKRSRPNNIVADERHLRPGDVPGTLLNMALLNLGSSDPTLRLASYNLLYALGNNFNFKVGKRFLNSKGI